MECKKIYQLHEMCNDQLPPCYLYKCEAEATTEMFMTTPEVKTSTYGVPVDHGYNFLYGLGVASCVVLGFSLLGFGIWKIWKYFRGSEAPLALEWKPEGPSVTKTNLV